MHVLLVEDDPSHATLILRSIEHFDQIQSVRHVLDGEQALKYLTEQAGRDDEPFPTFVLLDLNLPRISGLELLEKLKQDHRLKVIPIIVLTTSEQESDIQRAYDRGANSYLVKPLRLREFGTMIEELGMYWALRNRTAPKDKNTSQER